MFPVFSYEECCSVYACTCFLAHKWQCFSKVDNDVWNCWIIGCFLFYSLLTNFPSTWLYRFYIPISSEWVLSQTHVNILLMCLIFAKVMVEYYLSVLHIFTFSFFIIFYWLCYYSCPDFFHISPSTQQAVPSLSPKLGTQGMPFVWAEYILFL